MTEHASDAPSQNPSENIPAEQPVSRQRDVLRDLAWFELTRCMDDVGPRHMSQDAAMDVLFGQPAPQPREDS